MYFFYIFFTIYRIPDILYTIKRKIPVPDMVVSGGVTGVILYRLAGDKTGGCVALLAGGEAGSQMAGGKGCRVVVVGVAGGTVVIVLLIGEAAVGVDGGNVVAVLLVGVAVVGVDGGAVVAVVLVGEAVVGVVGGAVVVPAEREGGKIREIVHSEVGEGVRRIQARVRAQLSYSPAQ
jgi:hypothetical protein